MAPREPIDDLPEEEDNYRESSDEDFNPTAAAAANESSSSSDEDATISAQRKGKRKAPEAEDLDSGDEVTIEAARKRKTKRQKGGKGKDDEDLLLSDDEGGEGGLIKTRAQRAVEHKERRPLARTEGATIDVDALWAQMSATPLRPISQTATNAPVPAASKGQDVMDGATTAAVEDADTDLVAVQKVYTFAGQRTTEEKEVPRSKLEQYLSDGWKTQEPELKAPEDAGSKEDAETGRRQPKTRRPLRRPSRFDANPTGYVKALPPEYQLSWPRKGVATAAADQENTEAVDAPKIVRPEKAQKLNVVDKSRLDWTGFVDKEGIAEELDVHGKTKEAYLGRMEFLAGVEARKEEERRRTKTAAAT